jgi:small GTP-binding protein
MSYKYSYKIIVLGDQSVGKTAIVNTLNKKEFTNDYQSTIGVDFSTYHLNTIDNTSIKCQLWDTAGQESYDSIIKNYYRNIAGAIIVFDVNNTESYNHIQNWVGKLHKNCNNDFNVPIIIVGNKTDVNKRTITKEKASNYAFQNDFLYVETSAKESQNIPDFLHLLSEKIYENMIYNQCEFGISKNPYMETTETSNIDDLFCDVKNIIKKHNCCNIF